MNHRTLGPSPAPTFAPLQLVQPDRTPAGGGQLAHRDFGMSVGDAGAFLAQLNDTVGQDPLGATHCP